MIESVLAGMVGGVLSWLARFASLFPTRVTTASALYKSTKSSSCLLLQARAQSCVIFRTAVSALLNDEMPNVERTRLSRTALL